MIRAALAFVLLGWASLASAQESAPREVRLEVHSDGSWAGTGIEVQPGDALAIKAEPARTPAAVMSPGGVGLSRNADTNAGGEGLPAPEMPYAALIGRIGDGAAFMVGADYQAKATAAGPVQLSWNVAVPIFHGRAFFPVVVAHDPFTPADKIDGTGNEIATNGVDTVVNSIVANGSVEAVLPSPPPPPRRRTPAPAAVEPPPRSADPSGAMPWALGGLGLLLLAGAGFVVQRTDRARTAKRTRAMLSLAPRLDLGEEMGRGGDLPAEGPAASLRARLEPGAARMAEGEEDG